MTTGAMVLEEERLEEEQEPVELYDYIVDVEGYGVLRYACPKRHYSGPETICPRCGLDLAALARRLRRNAEKRREVCFVGHIDGIVVIGAASAQEAKDRAEQIYLRDKTRVLSSGFQVKGIRRKFVREADKMMCAIPEMW